MSLASGPDSGVPSSCLTPDAPAKPRGRWSQCTRRRERAGRGTPETVKRRLSRGAIAARPLGVVVHQIDIHEDILDRLPLNTRHADPPEIDHPHFFRDPSKILIDTPPWS